MKKIIIGVGLGVLILAGVIFVAQPNTSNNGAAVVASNGTFAVEESSSYDFGSISMAAGKVTRQFKVRNTGAETVSSAKCTHPACVLTRFSLKERKGLAHTACPDMRLFQ